MKFKLEIDMNDKMFNKEKLSMLARLLEDVSERLDAHWMSGDTGDGIIWDSNDREIGSFGIV